MSNRPSVIEIVAKLRANTKPYYDEMQKAGKATDKFTRDAQGRFVKVGEAADQAGDAVQEFYRDANGRLRDAKGRFVGMGDAGVGAANRLDYAFRGLPGKLHGYFISLNKTIMGFTWRWMKRFAMFGGAAAAAFTGFSIKRAIDKEELENYFKVVMGGLQAEATKWAEDLGKRWKLNPTRFKETLATFKQMTEGMGLSEAQAYEMAKALTKLNVDMASLRNVGLDEMFQKIQSGLSGEIEPLKRFGIILSEAQTQAYAYANGIAQVGASTDLARRKQELASNEYRLGVQKVRESSKSDMEKAVALEKLAIRFQQTTEKIQGQKQKLSEAEKVMARFGLLMQLTGKDQGDYENTMESTSNRLKQMRDQLEILQEKWGLVFLKGVNEAANAIMPFFEKAGKWIDQNREKLERMVSDGIKRVIQGAKDLSAWWKENGDGILAFFGQMADAIATAGKAATALSKFADSKWGKMVFGMDNTVGGPPLKNKVGPGDVAEAGRMSRKRAAEGRTAEILRAGGLDADALASGRGRFEDGKYVGSPTFLPPEAAKDMLGLVAAWAQGKAAQVEAMTGPARAAAGAAAKARQREMDLAARRARNRKKVEAEYRAQGLTGEALQEAMRRSMGPWAARNKAEDLEVLRRGMDHLAPSIRPGLPGGMETDVRATVKPMSEAAGTIREAAGSLDAAARQNEATGQRLQEILSGLPKMMAETVARDAPRAVRSAEMANI